MAAWTEFMVDIAEAAGKRLLEYSEGDERMELEFKNERDIVTEYDRATEEFLVARILKRFPEHRVWGEEGGVSEGESEFTWIIDPIDGTTSFVHKQPFYSISIALVRNGAPLAGVVHAPRLGETFAAETGKGAVLNGRDIRVSSCSKLIDAVLATGFACLRAELPENNLARFAEIAPKIRGIRRYGSAALDLAYVACGRLDGFWEMNLKPYDIAAGALIVAEAGGMVTDFNGVEEFPERGTLATNGRIHERMLELVLN